MPDPLQISRRERQIMELLYARGEVSVNELAAALPDAPSSQSIRTFLQILEHKGHLTHRRVGKENLYKPTRSRARVAKTALRRLLDTFFGGSIERALATHLLDPKTEVTPEQLRRLEEMIAQARRKGE